MLCFPVAAAFLSGSELALQAEHQLGSELRNIHSGGNHKLAAQNRLGTIFIGKLAAYATILALLIPAEAPVWNRFRTDKLKASQQRISLRYEEALPHHRDFD